MKKWLGFLMMVTGLLVIFGLWKFQTVFGVLIIYPVIFTKLTGVGMNKYIAEAFSLLIASIIYFGIYQGLYKKNKTIGIFCFIGLLIIQSLFMFAFEKNRFYSLGGKPSKWVTFHPITGEPIIHESNKIVDLWGQTPQPVDQFAFKAIYMDQNKDKFPIEEVSYDKIKDFYNMRTGKPIVFYCKNDEEFHFYFRDGYDSKYGKKLLPVTQEVIDECQKKYGSKKKDEIEELNKQVNAKTLEIEQKCKRELADSRRKISCYNEILSVPLLKSMRKFRGHGNKNEFTNEGWQIWTQDMNGKEVVMLIYATNRSYNEKDGLYYFDGILVASSLSEVRDEGWTSWSVDSYVSRL